MQIVIDIPEKDYQLMKDGHIPFNILDKMMNGTPLPKGHGRLVDADELYNELEFPTQQFASAFKQVLDDAFTIIEVDTESEE